MVEGRRPIYRITWFLRCRFRAEDDPRATEVVITIVPNKPSFHFTIDLAGLLGSPLVMGIGRRERSELQIDQLGQKLFFSSRKRDAVPRRSDSLSGGNIDGHAPPKRTLSPR